MIKIKNIYYMLTYAYSVLNNDGYRDILAEDFENAADLFAAVLSKGIGNQIKRGLGKGYIDKSEALSKVTGKIVVSESIRGQNLIKKQLFCDFDDYSENIYINQIIKTTIMLLISSNEVKPRNKRKLKKDLMYLTNIDVINPYTINWENIKFHRNNSTYKMLLNICYLIIKGMLMSESEGTVKLSKYINDESMHKLYEKFILEYYKTTYSEYKVSSSHITWSVDNDFTDLLPIMKSDIMIESDNKILIIDAKYYRNIMQKNTLYDSLKIRSGHLYQIFAYVKNKAMESDKQISGLLLYAGTDDGIQPDKEYFMSGNHIGVETLNLNAMFADIKAKLDVVIKNYF